MAMVLRTVAAKLRQKIPAAVQRVLASSRAPATSRSTPAGLDRFNPEVRRAVEEFVNFQRKNRRDEALARGAGLGLAALTLSLGIHRLKSC
ncbi:unnamed protein product [Alopecurus aequalis]